MFTALVASLVVFCVPYVPHHPKPVVVTQCEGVDRVRRINGREVERQVAACRPVRLTTPAGWKFGLSRRG